MHDGNQLGEQAYMMSTREEDNSVWVYWFLGARKTIQVHMSHGKLKTQIWGSGQESETGEIDWGHHWHHLLFFLFQ